MMIRLATIAATVFILLQFVSAQDATELEQQSKKIQLIKKPVRIDVTNNTKEYAMEKLPILDFKDIKNRPIEHCDILQGSLVEVKAGYIKGMFPVSMDKRWFRWLRYGDAQFLVFRENPDSPIYCARFSRAGFTIELWNIDLKVIKSKANKDIILMRDTYEENGPAPDKNSATYLYVAPRTIIYHEINFLGKTVKLKQYVQPYDINIVDAVVFKKRFYMIKEDSLITLTVNEDKMTEDQTITISANSIKQVGITLGGVFMLVIKSPAGHNELVANSNFTADNAYTHLKGQDINLIRSGNRQYVVYVKEDLLTGKGKYFYIVNPSVKKPSGLVFEPVPEIDMEYDQVFELRDRIHFLKENLHQMFQKGAKRTLIKYLNNQPIVGILYWSSYQYINEDQFLTVNDVGPVSALKVANVNLTEPRVICPPRPNSMELYVKFSVFTKTTEYAFDVVFHTTGTFDFIAGSFFDHIVTILAGIACLIGAWVWLRKTINDRDYSKLNAALARQRAITHPDEDLNGQKIEDRLEALQNDDNEFSGFSDND